MKGHFLSGYRWSYFIALLLIMKDSSTRIDFDYLKKRNKMEIEVETVWNVHAPSKLSIWNAVYTTFDVICKKFKTWFAYLKG